MKLVCIQGSRVWVLLPRIMFEECSIEIFLENGVDVIIQVTNNSSDSSCGGSSSYGTSYGVGGKK